jgi:hypothetical protein
MPFVDERFDTIHQLLRQQNLSLTPGPFNSQADVSKAYRESAMLITRTIPHEAGHAVVGLALDAGDVLEWIAIYAVRDPSWLVNLSKRRGSRLMEITIPKKAISDIRQELRDAGVTESVVYPDFDGLGRELKQVWDMRH